ncbi:hypothetical protein ACP70R_002324 [Stipagrostis hirtigluma subsp. patula]
MASSSSLSVCAPTPVILVILMVVSSACLPVIDHAGHREKGRLLRLAAEAKSLAPFLPSSRRSISWSSRPPPGPHASSPSAAPSRRSGRLSACCSCCWSASRRHAGHLRRRADGRRSGPVPGPGGRPPAHVWLHRAMHFGPGLLVSITGVRAYACAALHESTGDSVAVVFAVDLAVDVFHADTDATGLTEVPSHGVQAAGSPETGKGRRRRLHRAVVKNTAGLLHLQSLCCLISCRSPFTTGADEAHRIPAGVYDIKIFLMPAVVAMRGFSLHPQPPLSVLEQGRPFHLDVLTGVHVHRRSTELLQSPLATDTSLLHVVAMQSSFMPYVLYAIHVCVDV